MTTTTKKWTLRLAAVLSLATMAACDDSNNNNNNNGSPDMAMTTTGSVDMAQPACVMNPTTNVEFLNACTTAQSGDPTKDAPYFPSLAPNGNLPPLP